MPCLITHVGLPLLGAEGRAPEESCVFVLMRMYLSRSNSINNHKQTNKQILAVTGTNISITSHSGGLPSASVQPDKYDDRQRERGREGERERGREGERERESRG